MRSGTAISNGTRQYAVSIDNNAWYQLESATGSLVANTGLAPSAPVARWRGQVGTGTNAAAQVRTPIDYCQGIAIQNTSQSIALCYTTTDDQTGGVPTSRTTANAFQIAPGKTFSLNVTDGTKIYLRAASAGTVVASIVAT